MDNCTGDFSFLSLLASLVFCAYWMTFQINHSLYLKVNVRRCTWRQWLWASPGVKIIKRDSAMVLWSKVEHAKSHLPRKVIAYTFPKEERLQFLKISKQAWGDLECSAVLALFSCHSPTGHPRPVTDRGKRKLISGFKEPGIVAFGFLQIVKETTLNRAT